MSDEFSVGVFDTTSPEEAKKDTEFTGIPYFNLRDGETAVIRFLLAKAKTFYQHRVWDKAAKKGTGGWRVFTCIRTNCPLCRAGDRPSYKGAYPIIHIDNVEVDGAGKQQRIPRFKILIRGVNDITVLEKKANRYNLTEFNMDVERVGKGTSTQYLFEKTETKDMPQCDYKKEDVDVKKFFAVQLDVMQRVAADILDKKGGAIIEQNAEAGTQDAGQDLGSDEIPF